METFKETIAKMIATGEYSAVMNMALNLIIEDNMTSIALNDLLLKQNMSINDLKDESLVVILDYANKILEDDILTEDEMRNIGLLKLFLRVKPNDFSIYGKANDIKDILMLQLKRMYADDMIDNEEALMKTKLQTLFDLSYDEFLNIVNVVAKESLERGADVRKLDTFISPS